MSKSEELSKNFTPIMSQLVEELGYDPLDREHGSYDDYNLASSVLDDALTGLHDYVVSLYEERYESSRRDYADVSGEVSRMSPRDERT